MKKSKGKGKGNKPTKETTKQPKINPKPGKKK